MPPAKHRPAKLEVETKTYNVVFPVELLDGLKKLALSQKTSPAQIVRTCVSSVVRQQLDSEAFSAKPSGFMPKKLPAETPGTLIGAETAFAEGVEAACEKLAKNPRLNVKMATGGTMGDDIAQRIKKELLG